MFSSFMHLNHQMNVPADDQFMRGIQIIQHPLINDPEKKIMIGTLGNADIIVWLIIPPNPYIGQKGPLTIPLLVIFLLQ